MRFPTYGLIIVGIALQTHAADLGISHQQADDILNELRQIRQLLGSTPRPMDGLGMVPQASKISLSLEKSEMIGSVDAPLTLVEFTDYQCPFCQRFHLSTFPEIKKKYIDMGVLRFYNRDLPLPIHDNAMRAAQAARCAGEQGQFWDMRNRLQSDPEHLAQEDLVHYAQDLKLDLARFRECLETERYRELINKDALQARSIGANGTPSFVIGRSTADGVDGQLIVGAQPFEVFEERLKELQASNRVAGDGKR
jgi:protein-disulfide isomerase